MEKILTRQPRSFHDLWVLAAPVGLATLLATLAIWMLITQTARLPGGWLGQNMVAADLPQTHFTAETGIRVVRVAVVAGGGMVDVRYQVVDPDKAIVVHDDENPLTIIDEATGRELNIPFHDHNDTNLRTAITYSDLLVNSGGLISPGRIVTVVVGNSRLEHVVAQ